MVSALTTAAVINCSAHPPEEPVEATRFMPNHRDTAAAAEERVWDDDTLQRMSDYNVAVAEEAARQKARAARG